MEFNLRDFENLNLYSNSNLEKIIGSLVNESSNAALVNVYEDSLILLDHTEGDFYVADYNFDKEDLTVSINNFDKIELVKEETSFKDKVFEFFEEESSVSELTESFKQNVIEQDAFLNDLINEAMIKKDFSNYVNYEAIRDAIDETELESVNLKVFEEYSTRTKTHPLTEIKSFNFKDEVIVSLVETEDVKLINKSAVDKARELWKKENFKESFNLAASVFVEDVVEGAEMFSSLFEEYPQVFFLDEAERKTLLGKTLISDSVLRENMKEILKGVDILFEKYDVKELKDNYLAEAGADGPGKGKDDGSGMDSPSEVEDVDLEKIANDLKAIAEKIEDESAKKKIDDIISKLEKGKEEGTRPEVVKEAVSILML